MLKWIKFVLELWNKRENKIQLDADMGKLTDLIKSQEGNPAKLVVRPEAGSAEFEWAERMVSKNRLVRQPRGMGYSLPE